MIKKSTEEIARLCGINVNTLRYWVKTGIIRPANYTGRRRVETEWTWTEGLEAFAYGRLRKFKFSPKECKGTLEYLRGRKHRIGKDGFIVSQIKGDKMLVALFREIEEKIVFSFAKINDSKEGPWSEHYHDKLEEKAWYRLQPNIIETKKIIENYWHAKRAAIAELMSQGMSKKEAENTLILERYKSYTKGEQKE